MKEQNYSNHKRYVPGFHFIFFALAIIAFLCSIFLLVRSYIHGIDRVSSTIIFLGALNVVLLFIYARQFPLRAQDRAIRAEENLRHFVLTGKLFDPRLTMSQIIALRFASDAEFPELTKRAISENLSNDSIKKAIKTWRPDHHRA